MTPLLCAVSEGRHQVVQALLAAGADSHVATEVRQAGRRWAAVAGHHHTIHPDCRAVRVRAMVFTST